MAEAIADRCAWGPCRGHEVGELGGVSEVFGFPIPHRFPLCASHLALLENWRGRYALNPATFFTLKGMRNETP